MASHVMHYTAGDRLTSNLRLSENIKKGFMLGNMIVDSSKIYGNEQDPEKRTQIKDMYRYQIQDEKTATHFRIAEDANKNVQLCDLKRFLEKYGDKLDNPTVLGYFFHLYTDNRFFKELFDEHFTFFDELGNETEIWNKNNNVKITKSGIVVPNDEFWSEKYYYGDFTKMNSLILKHYNITFNNGDILRKALELYKNPGIEETEFKNIDSIIIEGEQYIKQSESMKDSILNVFNQDRVIDFFDEVGEKFQEEYPSLVRKLTK